MEKKKKLILAFVIGIPILAVLSLTVVPVVIYYLALSSTRAQYKDLSKPTRPDEDLAMFAFAGEFKMPTLDNPPHFVRARITLGYQKESALTNELTERQEQMRNILNLILAGKRRDQISTVEQQLELREEMKQSLNHILSSGKIQDVYFSEFGVR
ncbi:MAG: flagellar basal body-associated FliL family protein [Leptospirales bacterium]|nr:flagellar basal body-associated FliL family protein [Leptospirales bacterium]